MITTDQATHIQESLMRKLRTVVNGEKLIICHPQGLQMTITVKFPRCESATHDFGIAAQLTDKARHFFHHVKLVAMSEVDGKIVASIFCSGIKNFSLNKAA